MKLYFLKILLFFLPLNILLTSYHVHNNNNNEPQTTPHHKGTIKSRVLSECDTQSSIYNNYEDMKSVKENFDRKTSQRFEEYDERMKTARQKRKEERNKNIQEIIEKDKMEKSLAEKIEKGCLRCGCGLGGGVLPVWGLVSGLWYATLSQHVTKRAIQKGLEAGVKAGFEGLRDFPGLRKLIPISEIKNLINPANYADSMTYANFITQVEKTNCVGKAKTSMAFCDAANWNTVTFSQRASQIAENAAGIAKFTEEGVLAEGASKTSSLTTGITSSIIAIVVIVLIMVIIYLILRYRRKKNMKKKLQYRKLLKE